MASSPAAPAAQRGARPRIGRYELCSEIASGGMGRVYLARAVGPAGFEKLVALKCIHPDLSSEHAFVEMFFDEARIAARIAHPNVCGVFDFGEADGRYYLAMEYLAGETVSRLVRNVARHRLEEPLYDALVARIVAEAAEGLHAAHSLVDEYGRSLEVVHRDVSPQNLFVTYDGGVRVVDFGIASAQGRLHRTTTGSLKGKLAYMSPEQMRREKPDRRADVWALGVVLWELLTRERLYRADSEVDLILSVLNHPVRAPTELRGDLDPDLSAIVMRALAKDREERTPTARDLSQALQRWIVGRGVSVGMAELADLMDRAFAAEKARTHELLDSARRADGSAAIELSALEPAIPITVDVPTRSPATRRARVAAPSGPIRERASRSPWIVAALGVALALVAAGWALYADGPRTAAAPPPGPTTTALALAATAPPEAPEEAPSAAASTPSAEPVPPPAAAPSAAPAPGPPPGERSRSRARSPAATRGAVHVEARGGWADVYVDGRRIGRTPIDVELPAGRARLELRPFGLAPPTHDASLRRTITIGARPVRVVVPLDE